MACTMCLAAVPAPEICCVSCMEDMEGAYLASKAARDRAPSGRPRLIRCASCPDILGVDMAADPKDPTRCIICAPARRYREWVRKQPLTVPCDCGCGARWEIPTSNCAHCDERFPTADGSHRDCPKAPPPPTCRCALCGDSYPEDDGYKGYCGLNCYTEAKPGWRREYD